MGYPGNSLVSLMSLFSSFFLHGTDTYIWPVMTYVDGPENYAIHHAAESIVIRTFTF